MLHVSPRHVRAASAVLVLSALAHAQSAAAPVARPLQVVVSLDGAPRVLDLVPHSVRAPHFELRVQEADGSLRAVEPPAPATYRGSVVGDPESAVAAGFTDAGLLAAIVLGTGERWFVEPADGGIPVAYQETWTPGSADCGNDLGLLTQDAPSHAFAPAPSRANAGGTAEASAACTMYVAELAIDADHEFYVAQGSSVPNTLATVDAYVNALNLIYARDLAIRHQLSQVVVRSSAADPYSNNDPGVLLDDFRAEWNGPQSGIQRDMAHLITGREVIGNIIGLAYVGVVCNTQWAYGWSQFTFGFSSNLGIMSHELGHNWGAPHCNEPGCYQMCGGCQDFGPDSTEIILAYRDNASCLTTEGPFTSPVPPTAVRDFAFADAGPVTIDVLANDFDANCDVVTIDFFETPTPAGGTVTRSVGTGPGGRDELVYSPPVGYEGLDAFQYLVLAGGNGGAGIVELQVSDGATELVLYDRLDELAGTTAFDSSPSGRDGTFENGPNLGQPGAGPGSGTSVGFGGGSRVHVPNGAGIGGLRQSFTVSAWIRPTSTSGTRRIFGNTEGWELGLSEGRPLFTTRSIQDYVLGGVTVPTGTWTHLVAVFHSSHTVQFYVNGSLAGAVGGSAPAREPSPDWYIGVRDPDGEYFAGRIDDLQVYDGPLSATEIQSLFQNPGSSTGCPTPANYCTALPNSSGLAASMTFSGSASVAANDLQLVVHDLPPGPTHTGIFITSPDQAQSPLGDGNLCLGTTTLGFIVRIFPGYAASAQGTASVQLDHLNPPLPVAGVDPGETWNYQAWFRDFVPGGSGFNLSDALSVTYCP